MKRTMQHTWLDRFRRRGTFVVVGLFALIAVVGLVALNVDTGVVSLEKTRLQNAVDAAALAAAQEISAAVEEAGENGGASDANAIAVGAARTMAAHVAELNGVYVDPERDVRFGKRIFDESNGTFSIAWDTSPYNVVQVTARRDNADTEAPDAELQLLFAPVVGRDSLGIVASATAFVEARDMVVVLDYSGSMNYDSQLRSTNKLPQTEIEANLQDIYESLGPPNLGDMTFEPQYLTVAGQPPQQECEAQIHVTFKGPEVFVESTKDITEVKVEFTNGDQQTFSGHSGLTGNFAGTGSNPIDIISRVWVKSGCSALTPVTVTGDPPTSGSDSQVEVTFTGTSVSIESSKDLSNVVLKFSDGIEYKFDDLSDDSSIGQTGTFAGIGSNAGKTIVTVWVKSGNNPSGDGPGYGERFDSPLDADEAVSTEGELFEDTNDNVRAAFGLDSTPYPYPSGSWNSYINYVRTNYYVRNTGYRQMYGGLTFVNYLLEKQPGFDDTPDLWMAPAYPFHAMKNGMTLFTQFLDDLEFGDHLGLVTYDSSARVETMLDESQIDNYVDLGDEPLTIDYALIDSIQTHKQAAHYDVYTGLGYGINEARDLLLNHGRDGARPTILVMTDGNANRSPHGWQLPGDWSWSEVTDSDGDGNANYYTSNKDKQYALWQAWQAIESGYVIHTLSVGAGADKDLMKAIANAGGGIWIDVPGGSTIAELEAQMLAAFSQIAANVPPAKLLIEPDSN